MTPVRNISDKKISNGASRPLLAAFICLILGILLVSFIDTTYFHNSIFIPANHISKKIEKTQDNVYIKGRIISDPLFYETHWKQKRASFTLEVDYIKLKDNWAKTQGLCKVTIYKSDQKYVYGDNLILFGSLSLPTPAANPGEFNYSTYLKHQKIHVVLGVDSYKDVTISQPENKYRIPTLLKSKIFALRKKVDEYIHLHLPKKEAGLISAIILGLRSEIPRDSREVFIQTGSAHILAISGLHLAIIAYVFFFLLGLMRIPYNTRALIVIIIICFYAILCGGRTPITRAAIMITIFLLARILNREIDIYNALSLAGILMLLANPAQLFSVGFILSFGCVFSIAYITPKMKKIYKPLAISLAVYIGIAPIIAYNFNIISPITIVANLFVIPLTGLLICAGLTFILFGFLSASLATIFGATTWLIIFLLEKIIFYLSKIPYAYFYVPDISLWLIACYYIFIILILNKEKFKLSRAGISIIILLCINLYIWSPLIRKSPEQLKITFLHVGHGDAIVIQFPDGKTMLVDAGAKSKYKDNGREVVIPYLWHEGINKIDYALITHSDLDHFGGIASVIKKVDVKSFLYNGREDNEYGYLELLNLVESKEIKKLEIKEGDRIEGFKGVEILVLGPPEEFLNNNSISDNDSSVVLKLIYKNTSLLLCGDIAEKGMKNIISYANVLKSDIIKVPHHGLCVNKYKSTAEQFYYLVDPEIAVVTASKNDPYLAPATSTIECLSKNGATMYVTHKTGAIIITSNGEDYHITTTCGTGDV